MRKGFVGLFLCLFTPCLLALTGDPDAGKAKSQTCTACHNYDGNSIVGNWPKIAGQHESYLKLQMLEFKKGESGDRYELSMYNVVQNLTEQDIADLAAYYASQTTTLGKTNRQHLALGQKLYRGGDLNKGISACAACHHANGLGNELANFPRLSGQNAEYTAQQLRNYRDGTRKSDVNGIMRDIASRLSDEEIEALSSYVEGLH